MKRRATDIARLFVLALLVMVMVSLMGTMAFAQETDISAEKECYLTGDMNADGSFGTEDAIYTLYHTLFEDSYPIRQNVDVNGDDTIDTMDAIEILYATLFDYMPKYENFGKLAHDYYDPAWSWETADGVAATVTLQCACGEKSHTMEAEVLPGEKVDATCTAPGYQVYTAQVSDDDDTFTATYKVTLPATGHEAGETAFNLDEHYTCCANCGEVIESAIHEWKENGAPVEGDCKIPTVQHYLCSCGAAKSEKLGTQEHAWKYVEDVLVEGCTYARKHVCGNCGEVKLTDEYVNHNLVASIQEATCKNNGQKTYTCSKCGTVDRTETVPSSDDMHVWNDGVEANGVITYTCGICGQTKTAVVAKDDGTISGDALQNADELEVGDATMSMDEDVKENLGNNDVQITVDELKPEQLADILKKEELAQIEGNTVYDFNMSVGGQEVSNFDGKITISLPYTLEPGEDIDGIDVWYINANGELVQQEATYSNGFVTFTTDHFSYYTVTRLTPEQRCARYDHIWSDASKLPTCTSDGYTKRVCQRCAKEEVLENQPALGHDYKTTVTEPTCDKFGSTVTTCTHCGHTTSSVVPALGHKLKLSETIDATCDAAGKRIFVCANGCGHETEQAIPQLSHDYDYSDTVEATCTTGGYDIYVCKHCGDEIKKNETTPIGHNFSTESAQWVWNKKNTSATLTLTCDHGCGSTKELKATVTTVEASCLNDGLVLATVYYNNKTYSDKKAGDPAMGHKPGAEWIITDSYHYYECEICGEKIEIATHDLSDGVVTKEPTCSDGGMAVYTCSVCGYSVEEVLAPNGKHSYDEGVVTKEPTCATKGSKVYTCSVCGKTREEAIPATGDHDYVDGKCSVCGKTQSDCNHQKHTEKLIDISGFGICEGAKFVEISCECGEFRIIEIDTPCDMVEVYSEETAYSIVEAYECSKCGLYAIAGQGIRFNSDPCIAEAVYWAEIKMGDRIVAEFDTVMDSVEHYTYVVTDTTKVNTEDMCDLIVRTVTCDCGERTQVEVQTNCEWHSDGNGDYAVCAVCGATREYMGYEPVIEGCKVTESWSYIFTNSAGEEIYNERLEYSYFEHNNELTNFELYGDSCEDGVWVEYTCTECGEVEEGYYTYHEMVHSTVTDLTGANICADAHVQYSCACGRAKEETLVYGEKSCQWLYRIDSEGEYSYGLGVCNLCGAYRYSDVIESEKDENCEYVTNITYTYTDAKGTILVIGELQATSTDHNIQREYELLGNSCIDGVVIKEYCTDCDWYQQWECYDHDTQETVYYLSDYGFCGGEVYVGECPCGDQKYIRVDAWSCDWTGMGDEGWEYHECLNCGGVWESNWHEEAIDDCHGRSVFNYSFRINGEEILYFEGADRYTSHRWICEFTLHGKTCEDGYTCTLTCLDCGETEKFDNWGCEMYVVNREMYTDTGLCGDVELITYSCACGARTHAMVVWQDTTCEFRQIGYNKEEDSYIYECMNCGAIRNERNYNEQVPGKPECYRQYRWEYTYSLNGVELFTEFGTEEYTEHDWNNQYELLGTSCEDGVRVRPICEVCGETASESILYYHEMYEKHFDLREHGFCGGEIRFCSCPCGEQAYADVNVYNCMWQRVVDSEGYAKYVCVNCGGIWEVSQTEVELNSCIYYIEYKHTFTLADGSPALSLEWVEKHENHAWKTTFELEGASCEDGVQITNTCELCGQSDSYYTRDHDQHLMASYNLSDYGMCDGHLEVFSCACGEYQGASWSSNCTWHGIGGEGITGFDETCENCGMTWSWHWEVVEQIDTCTTREKNTIIFAKGEHTIVETWNEIRERHDYVYHLTLWEGSETCEDGYYVERYCQDCGRMLGGYGESSHHDAYLVATQPVELDAPICGKAVLNTYSCACGQQSFTDYSFPNCQFEYFYHDQYGWGDYCVNCGLRSIGESYTEPVEGTTCQYKQVTTTTYLIGDEVVTSSERVSYYESHATVSTQTLLVPGGTCDDGYSYTYACVDCGQVHHSGINYGCQDMQRIGYERLGTKGELCGDLILSTHSCACGKNSNSSVYWQNGRCNFESYWDQELDCWIYTCSTCGVQELYTNSSEYIEGTQCEYRVIGKNVFMRDGVELFSYETYSKSTRHNEVSQLTLVVPGGTCDEGYTVTRVCLDCGKIVEQDPNVYYGCSNYVVDRKPLAEMGDLCGDLSITYHSCACGKQSGSSWNWHGGSCWFQYDGYLEDEQCYRYTCDQCGAYRKEYNEHTKLDGSECKELHKWDYVYYNVNGDYLFTESGENINHNGIWIHNYYLMGDTCDDGYTWTRYCYYCGETEENTDINYGCNSNLVEFIPIAQSDVGACGSVGLYVYECACGGNLWWNLSGDCNFYWVEWDQENQRDIYRCNDCGLYYTGGSRLEKVPGSCDAMEIIHYEYWFMDGEEKIYVGSLDKVINRKQHVVVYDLIPVEGATSCEDGYYAIGHCIYCDFVSDNGICYGHTEYVTQSYNLGDYGMCGGYAEKYSCACGENQRWNYSYYDCNYNYTGNRNEYGMQERYCSNCNTYFYISNNINYVPEECANKYQMYLQLTRDGAVLLEVNDTYEQEEHLMMAIGFDGTCGDRVTVYSQCYYCGEQETNSGATSHNNLFRVDYLDLKMIGACGGYAEQYSCACGERLDALRNTECYFEYDGYKEVEIDGITHYTATYTCNDCGLSIFESYYDTQKDENCNYTRVYTYEYRMNGELLKIMTENNSYTSHDYTLTGRELLGESCEDGVRLTYSCACGESYTNLRYDHNVYLDEERTIDLSQYGAVCGCELQISSCMCGQYQECDLVGECDLDCRFTDMWIEDALDVWQPVMEEWISLDSVAYTYTCAVTDPKCDLGIRMAYVWMKSDNCTAVRYEIWQLGYREIYDEATDETTCVWEQEILIPTGQVSVYHDYEYMYSDDRIEGNGTTTESYICKDCDSSYITVTEYTDDFTTRWEKTAINTLDNGMNKEYRSLRVCDAYIYGAYRETLSRSSWIYPDGREYWYEYVTSYTSEEGCKYQQIYRDCNGEESVQYEGEHYITSSYWEYEKYPTCSQPGVEVRTDVCQLCQAVIGVEYYDANPNRHEWWWDYEKGQYYCGICGLENCNGADGTIVLEDLTEDYGNGSNYVVGYWNRGTGNFLVYASVVLDDATDEMNELVLTDIEFNYLTVENDGINAISTNQASIAEAAAAAIADAGYTGSYAIRIAFVSADDDGKLDYAITFDSVMA